MFGEISGSHGGLYEDESSGMLRCVVWYKFTDVSEVLTASIIRVMTSTRLHRATSQKTIIFNSMDLGFSRRRVEGGRSFPTFQLMMEAAKASEMLVNFYQTTQCYKPEDSHLHLQFNVCP
jgi:hypothetical protein